MQKRKYTRLKAVEGLILAMRQDGMNLHEIADELGLSHQQLRNWLYRQNRERRNFLEGMSPKPKGRPRKDGQAPDMIRKKNLNDSVWSINYYGIFYCQKKGCEIKDKISRYLSAPERVFCVFDVQIF